MDASPDRSQHPCFDNAARLRYSRVHLPVAVDCNAQCNYCDRRFDCANESRPGVTSALLAPARAADYVDAVRERDPSLRVVGIAGPGDPLATADATLSTLSLVRDRHPNMLLCVATNGLALPAHAEALAELGVSHVTVTVNAVDPNVGAEIYRWIRDGSTAMRGLEAGEHLWHAQSAGIRALVKRGVMVKINCILIPGVNSHHVTDVAREVSALGAARFNCLPLRPIKTTPFGSIPEPPRELVRLARDACAVHIPQMEHCSRCRADAVGRIGHVMSTDQLLLLRRHATTSPTDRPRVAVASHEGVFVNEHLGEATRFFVFERRGDAFVCVGERPAPTSAHGSTRWKAVADLLNDCRALLTTGFGASPKRVLDACGLPLVSTEGLIEDALDAVYQGRALRPPRDESFRCGKGIDCNGTGTACG